MVTFLIFCVCGHVGVWVGVGMCVCGCKCVYGCVVFNRIHLCKYDSRFILENHGVVTSTPVLKGINHTMDIENALA